MQILLHFLRKITRNLSNIWQSSGNFKEISISDSKKVGKKIALHNYKRLKEV